MINITLSFLKAITRLKTGHAYDEDLEFAREIEEGTDEGILRIATPRVPAKGDFISCFGAELEVHSVLFEIPEGKRSFSEIRVILK